MSIHINFNWIAKKRFYKPWYSQDLCNPWDVCLWERVCTWQGWCSRRSWTICPAELCFAPLYSMMYEDAGTLQPWYWVEMDGIHICCQGKPAKDTKIKMHFLSTNEHTWIHTCWISSKMTFFSPLLARAYIYEASVYIKIYICTCI